MSNSVSPRTVPLTGQVLGGPFGARLLDFTGDTTPWQRRLWSLGTTLALREVYEAGPWVDAQVLSPAALHWLCRDLERLAGDDAGLGVPEVRRQLREVLRADLSEHSRHRRRLSELISLINESYIQRWTAAVDVPETGSPERLARAVAAHLLDHGYSMGFLHRTIRHLIAAEATVGDFLAEAGRLANASPREFEVMVPFHSMPQQQLLAEELPEWRSGPRTREWLAAHSPGDLVYQNGAFLYSIQAMDPYAAGRKAGEILDKLLARSTFLRRKRSGLKPIGRLWVASLDESLPLEPPARGVDILSLQKSRTMYRVIDEDLLDNALELAAPLNRGARGPAVAGGWAALESLLHHAGDPADRKDGRAIAAARMAALVTCSWPRAELTALSHAHKPETPDLLARQLASAASNRERAIAVASALRGGRVLATKHPADAAAAARMSTLIASPQRSLLGVRAIVEGALRRLYRQRNIVLHGGSTQAVALDASLRTCAPLVGAGLDRIAHAYLTYRVQPLTLATRAETRLALTEPKGTAQITDLLEQEPLAA
jgi:hypothetical protein